MKKSITAIVVVVVLALAGATYWYFRNTNENGDLALHGNVDIRQIALAFDGSGRVLEMHVDEGDSVKAGTVLGVLDTRTLELQAEQAQAQIEVQRQNLARLHNGSRQRKSPRPAASWLLPRPMRRARVKTWLACKALRLKRKAAGSAPRTWTGLAATSRSPKPQWPNSKTRYA